MPNSPTKMFPPNLQKNIRELNRQISLLEIECDHIDSKKKEAAAVSKLNSKDLLREQSSKPYVTEPSFSKNLCSPNKKTSGQVLLETYSASGGSLKTGKKSRNLANNHEKTPKLSDEESGGVRKKEKNLNRKLNVLDLVNDRKKPSNKSFVKKDSDSSDDNCMISKGAQSNTNSKRKKNDVKVGEDQSLMCSKESQTDPSKIIFSDEALSCDENEVKATGERWRSENKDAVTSRGIIKKRRPRSARTKKNYVGDMPLDVSITKTLQEKETQCVLWNEGKDKTEFLVDLNDTISILQALIDEVKETSTHEKRNEIRDEMKNTLMKISGIKSINALNSSLGLLTTFGGNKMKWSEDNGSIKELKKIMHGVKQFCQEVSDEKSVLLEELAVRNRTIESMKNKEKEYLALISSLKFNLEKIKEEAEEGNRAKRDFIIAKTKLQEEKKVIEALKKSHRKMQELVENYVLENDKLRTQVKMAQLDTQKYTILLDGKEAEISKYKEDIKSFQKQISEQLNLMRSQATESKPKATLKAIGNKANIFSPTEGESCVSETTYDNHEYEQPSSPASTKTSLESTCTHASPVGNEKSSLKEGEANEARSVSKGSSFNATKGKDGSFTTCQSDESETESNKKNKKFDFGLDEVFPDSKQLRENINEILHDMTKERSEKDSPSSCNTSHCTISTSSVNSTEGSRKE